MSETTKTGSVVSINGNMVSVAFDTSVIQNEVAYVILGDIRLKSEVIRVRGSEADLQVFEDTSGIKVGTPVEFSGDMLSVGLAPGLLTQVFDGLQNPLPKLAEDRAALDAVAERYALQIRGVHGEHSESEGGVFDISNRRRLGTTEVEAVQQMHDGVVALIVEEKRRR